MNISDAMAKMIDFLRGNIRDINHFMKVYGLAKLIAEQERLPAREQQIVELTAIVHDLARPFGRDKYGYTSDNCQEQEIEIQVRDFFVGLEVPIDVLNRVAYIVSHSHSYHNVDGIDFQILVEADFIVSADEQHYTPESIRNTLNSIFVTGTGISLIRSIFGIK